MAVTDQPATVPSREAFKMRIGRNLLLYRTARGFSQREVGEQIGKTGMAIAHYEAGRSMPDPYELIQLAEVLGIEVERFYEDPDKRLFGV